jgi:prepilin-type N-terminal cleavage/methylation domain-containing protein
MKHGLTLIELLVTLAIVATLVGILAPSLAGVRAAARTTKCNSNLRQLGLAFNFYADTVRSLPPLGWDCAELDAPEGAWLCPGGTQTTRSYGYAAGAERYRNGHDMGGRWGWDRIKPRAYTFAEISAANHPVPPEMGDQAEVGGMFSVTWGGQIRKEY